MRARVAVLVVVLLVVPAFIAGLVSAQAGPDPSCWDLYDASGDRVGWVVEPYGAPPLSCTPATVCLDYFDRSAGRGVLVPLGQDPASCSSTPPTSSTTTVPPTTTTSSTTTVPPTSSTSSPTTMAPPTTTTIPLGTFVDTFSDGEGWRDRWDLDVHHRVDRDDPPGQPASDAWRADHDDGCGGADTFRMIDALGDRSQHFYRCGPPGAVGNAHVMTSLGDVDGYSVLSMSPRQTFATVGRVCWDQNVTDQGGRQWTEVVVVPAAAVADGDLTHVNPEFVGVDDTTKKHTGESFGVMVHGQYWGLNVFANGVRIADGGYQWDRDVEGQQSRAIRRQHCLTANANGTVTVRIDQAVSGFYERTVVGRFPADARVIFEQHAYTPDKDGEACRPRGVLVGCRYSWHWDNVTIEV